MSAINPRGEVTCFIRLSDEALWICWRSKRGVNMNVNRCPRYFKNMDLFESSICFLSSCVVKLNNGSVLH